MIRTRFDKEFLIQVAITQLGSHVVSYEKAIWRLVSGHCPTPPLLTAEGRHRIWTRWTMELPRTLAFGDKVLSSCLLLTALRTGHFFFIFLFLLRIRPIISTIFRTFPYLALWESLSLV